MLIYLFIAVMVDIETKYKQKCVQYRNIECS